MGSHVIRKGPYNPKLRRFLMSERMVRVPEHFWTREGIARQTHRVVELWLSGDFMAQVFAPLDGGQRVTVSRTTVGDDGRWHGGISWDDLQRVKREIGRGQSWAVELFPADEHLVDVANMRHLFLLPDGAPPFAWLKEETDA